MENQTLLGGISSTEDGFITEIFSQNSPFNSENLNFENTVINKPGKEGFHSSQDSHLCAMAIGETLLDQFKYPLTIESQNTILKVKIQPLVEDNHNEILGKCQKLQDLNPSEEAKHTYPPYSLSHSYNVHFLSSLMMQQRNSNVLSLSTCPPEGTINQNVRMIPVFRPLLDPVTGGNNCICYDQFKGMLNSCVQSQALPGTSNEPCSDTSTLPQTSAPVCDELVICQLKGGTQILCINNSGTRELKTVHLVPQYQNQHNYLQSGTKKMKI
uniref:Uncharacterized protein n=1 Tax=Terrapene triunguis TaxID=2587831 RepID=A0A674JPZ5_9SAUR